MIRIVVAVLLTVGTGVSVACESRSATSSVAAPTENDPNKAPALAAAYVCPMGCEGSASNEPGKCPVCAMTLERNPDHKPATQ
ncbi:heavy metal-binding domain-containing protein [uncultured Hymenobacter sp.]|uniref:heavy metal-binding domain-containing protein n=1 Tax=uncultured Hymenobacter sp. TaxID=170016 RepID=UPI0035C9D043